MDIFRSSVGKVNTYLLKNGNGFFMVDTGFSRSRARIEKLLTGAGCRPGDLKLILLTHGDTDHTGNAAYLRTKYGAKICLHPKEQRVAETGNMVHNRGPYARWQHILALPVMYVFGGTGKNRYTPDIWLEDGMDLNEYGLDARVIHLPGHTRGSVGILTAERDLFCGDLLITHRRVPQKNHLIHDESAMDASIEKLKTLRIRTVYPGHGRPFAWPEFRKRLITLFDEVVLTTDKYKKYGTPAGSHDKIIETYQRKGLPTGYEIAFTDKSTGEDYTMFSVIREDFEVIQYPLPVNNDNSANSNRSS